MNIAPDNIKELKPNEIFCYGANRSWRHGSGAAKYALKFGAVYDQGPFRGQTYGICTKDESIKTLPLSEIALEIERFFDFVRSHPSLTFLLTAIGTGLAKYRAEDIAPMFKRAPDNVHLPKSFWDILNS